MNFQLRSHLKQLEKLNYIQDGPPNEGTTEMKVDCSFGINPFGSSKQINKYDLIDHADFQSYPPFPYHAMKDEIIKYWNGTNNLLRENITVCAGSMTILDNINNLFIDNGDHVLGYSPQFPAYINSVRLRGGIYCGVPLQAENKYLFDPLPVISKLQQDDYKLVYLDNPNNPTGQIIPIEKLELIIKEAEKSSTIVIVDEAYGDYMDNQNSAISLMHKYNNLFVIRTFSKGYGLAGMRIGYVVASEALTDIYGMIDDYLLNPIGLEAAMISLRDNEFIAESIEATKSIKKGLIDSLQHLKIAETSHNVPILLLEHPDEHVNLFHLLQSYGIKTTTGFENVGVNAVRMRIPEKVEDIVSILNEVERDIS